MNSIINAFKEDSMTKGLLCCLLLLMMISALAPIISPFDPYDPASIDILDAELPPAWLDGDIRYWLGTDDQGRDLLSTILYGLRLSLIIGLGAVVLQSLIGISFGLLAGYYGGWVDSILMRFADIQLSFSTLMVAIIVLAVVQSFFGPAVYNQLAMYMLILVIGLAEWPQYARTIRANVLAEKEKEYIQAAHVLGYGPIRIMLRHILPNTLTPILVISTLQIANAIISEAALSFLGLGMPLTEPSLGALIRSGFEYIFSGVWWITLLPGCVLVFLVLVINLLGDRLRDRLNPKLAN